jgi:microcompartment protein CcmL/EutN
VEADGDVLDGAALGVIEFVGLVQATAVLDAMAKAARVRRASLVLLGDGLVAVALVGALADIQWALDAGLRMCDERAWPVTRTLLGRPDPAVVEVFGLMS